MEQTYSLQYINVYWVLCVEDGGEFIDEQVLVETNILTSNRRSEELVKTHSTVIRRVRSLCVCQEKKKTKEPHVVYE